MTEKYISQEPNYDFLKFGYQYSIGEYVNCHGYIKTPTLVLYPPVTIKLYCQLYMMARKAVGYWF